MLKLKDKIENYVNSLEKVSRRIRKDLEEYFKNYDYFNPNNEVQIVEIITESDLDKVIYGSGFYIILTDQYFAKNECSFEYQGLKAIYRGHSFFTRKRILSHLSNENYNIERKDNEPIYRVCLKIENNINGININKEPYKNWKWIVIVHKMSKSSKLIREQTEKAFDGIFKKPCKSIK